MVCCCALAGTAACNNCFDRTGSYSYSYSTNTIFPDIKKTQNNFIIINYNYIIQEQKRNNKRVDI